MDSLLIHQQANDLVQNFGTRNIKKIALNVGMEVSETDCFHDLLGLFAFQWHDHMIFINQHIDKYTKQMGVNPKFCVNAKLWCKIEQKYFKAGAAQAAAAFSTKITALRGDVKGGGVSLRSSRLLTFRLQPVSPACGRQRTPPTVRELRSSPAAFRSTSS